MVASSLLAAACADREPLAELAQHREIVRRLADAAASLWADGKADDAVDVIDMAATFAGRNHPGLLASPRLEEVLAEISRERLAPAAAQARIGEQERVLVVVTETYAVGAHTRTLWRWIARDPGRAYSIITTGQRGVMPDGVRAAVARSGGEIVDLPADAPPLERAGGLRRAAAAADLVVLIDHPFDPIATLAFAGLAERPPIVMMNAGDHQFWLGRRIVDALMCVRPLGVRLASRRGIPGARVLAGAFPVSGPDGNGRRADRPVEGERRAAARAQVLDRFGWPANTVLLVTAGRGAKFECPPPGQGLLELVEPVLADAPSARMIAIGPSNTGVWQEASARTGGRVAAVGELPDGIGLLHSAGDIYLESRPLGGPGAAAEAAAHGLPVIAYAATPLEREFFVTDSAYGTVCESSIDAYRSLLGRLIADPGLRASAGDSARLAVAAADASWEAAVERAYETARALGPLDVSELGPLPEPEDVDILIDSAMPVGRRAAIPRLEQITSTLELAARSPAVRSLYGRLDHHSFRQLRRYSTAFAAPPVGAAALRSVVAEFRRLRDAGVAQGFLIALPPDAAAAAVPVLEAAIAAGSDVAIDLVLDPNPAGVRPDRSLEVVVGGTRDGVPDRHLCADASATTATAPDDGPRQELAA
jgi:hypothetical protein